MFFSANELPIAIVGYDFRTASTAFREKLLLGPEARLAWFRELRQWDPEVGAVVLETCNRVEWMVSTEQPAAMAKQMTGWMLARLRVAFPDLENLPEPRCYLGQAAVRHWLQLAAGMESLAWGEAQIAGQIQQALHQARLEHRSSTLLNGLGNALGRMAKNASRLGFRSGANRGIHHLLMNYLTEYFAGHPDPPVILVVGMGAVGRRAAALLSQRWPQSVIAVNRTLPDKQARYWRAWSELRGLSALADAVIVATAADHPVITKDMLNLSGRRQPLLAMDLGMPRQIDPALAQNSGIVLGQLEHLLEMEPAAADPKMLATLRRELSRMSDSFRQFCCERRLARLFASL